MGVLAQNLQRWVNAALSFAYPEFCQTCGNARATPEDCFVCPSCRDNIKFLQPPFCERCGLPYQGAITTSFVCSNCADSELHFSSARSAVIAKGVLLDIIHRFKYQRALWFEPLLAGLLIDQARADLHRARWDVIVPIPLHPTRQREREFNQAERLGRRLSAACKIPLNNRLVCRAVPTRTQTLLSREERRTNVRRAFAMRAKDRLKGQRIVLVDDVFTTGATSSACARILRDAGASEVCVWTVARGI